MRLCASVHVRLGFGLCVAVCACVRGVCKMCVCGCVCVRVCARALTRAGLLCPSSRTSIAPDAGVSLLW